MEIEELKSKLRNLQIGKHLDFGGDKNEDASPKTINSILSELSGDRSVSITDDINGCDMDWSYKLTFEGMKFDTWGSIYLGSFMFQKKI